MRIALFLTGVLALWPSPWHRHTRFFDHVSVAAVQSLYRDGVPHTDRQGRLRTAYGSDSFFPRCIYHAIAGSFRLIEAAGFNCVHTWEGDSIADVIGEVRAANLQLIRHWPTDAVVKSLAADPNVLGWYLDEEPTAQTYLDMKRTSDTTLMAARYRAFLARKAAIKAIDPRHPVFPLDAAGIPPGYAAWWERWNTAGDVSAQDNYPLRPGTTDFGAISRSVLRAVRLNHERKPVWVTLQAFGAAPGLDQPAQMPTPAELRGMAFTAIVHGATGITLFAYDSHVTRAGSVLGIAPETADSDGLHPPVTAAEAAASRALWAGAEALNTELERLTPRLLSPTARMRYSVFFSGQSRTPGPIRTMLKDTRGTCTLLAVNIEARPFGTRFEFPKRIGSVKRLDADGTETVIGADGKMFTDSLDSFGAAVYEIRF
jgi:hypothetical protein